MIVVLWIIVVNLLVGIGARSVRSPPLHPSALSHPTFVSIHILPQLDHRQRRGTTGVDFDAFTRNVVKGRSKLRWDDKFYLAFQSHGNNITLSLRPSKNFVHPGGIDFVQESTNDEGVKSSVNRKMGRDEFRGYEGFVVDKDIDRNEWGEIAAIERTRSIDDNWARIFVLDDDEASDDSEDRADEVRTRFQGSFSINSETYTIHQTPNYLRTRQFLDPDPPLVQKRSKLSHPSMVIIRDGQTISPLEHVDELARRGLVFPETMVENSTIESTCGFDDLTFTFDYSEEAVPKMDNRRIKRQGGPQGNYINSIGSTVGCPKVRQVLFMGVAADCAFTRLYGSIENARDQLLTDFNTVSALYDSTFNISIGIVHLNIQSGNCPSTVSEVDPMNPWNVDCDNTGPPGLAIDERLSVFSEWRARTSSDGAGLWHLVTGCNTGREIGVAWTSQLCQTQALRVPNNQIASGTAVSSVTVATWIVIAHEIAHNFGALHDCIRGCSLGRNVPSCCSLSASTCDSQFNFIMSPFSNGPVNAFSPCSVGNVCSALEQGTVDASCLATPGESTSPSLISAQSCGNGILEEDEQCDPGSMLDPCCDASTCRFIEGAICSPRNSNCCTDTCQLSPQGTVCRESMDAMCDISQRCTGISTICPERCYVVDGNACGPNGLACASGRCTNLSLQCAAVGSRFGITEGCPITPPESVLCNVVCAAGIDRCTVFDQTVRDGSPCGEGGAGLCYSNICELSRMQPGPAAATSSNLSMTREKRMWAERKVIQLIH